MQAVVEIRDGFVTNIVNEARLVIYTNYKWIIDELSKRGLDPDRVITSMLIFTISSPYTWDYAIGLCSKFVEARDLYNCMKRVIINMRVLPTISQHVINLLNLIDTNRISRDVLRVAGLMP